MNYHIFYKILGYNVITYTLLLTKEKIRKIKFLYLDIL